MEQTKEYAADLKTLGSNMQSIMDRINMIMNELIKLGYEDIEYSDCLKRQLDSFVEFDIHEYAEAIIELCRPFVY